MPQWYNPAPNLPRPSPAERTLAGLVYLGLAAIGVALALAALAGWILLMIAIAAGPEHGMPAVVVLCTLIAMGGFGLAVVAAGLWSLLQVGSVRRALGLR
ncbi:MAG TPA: hypothetical protein VEK76_13760 [Candidatus Binatia bacterium]|nr:hypothetical protein [Candidatus Binatia bacterium]